MVKEDSQDFFSQQMTHFFAVVILNSDNQSCFIEIKTKEVKLVLLRTISPCILNLFCSYNCDDVMRKRMCYLPR